MATAAAQRVCVHNGRRTPPSSAARRKGVFLDLLASFSVSTVHSTDWVDHGQVGHVSNLEASACNTKYF